MSAPLRCAVIGSQVVRRSQQAATLRTGRSNVSGYNLVPTFYDSKAEVLRKYHIYPSETVGWHISSRTAKWHK